MRTATGVTGGAIALVLVLALVPSAWGADAGDKKEIPPADPGAATVETLIKAAAERIHILKDPERGAWEGRQDFTTRDGTFLVFENVPGLKGHAFYYQYKPMTRKLYCDKDGGTGQVEVLALEIRRNEGKPETCTALRIVPEDAATSKEEGKKKWLQTVAAYFGLRPESTVVLFPGSGEASATIYAVKENDAWRFFDMQGKVLNNAEFVKAP